MNPALERRTSGARRNIKRVRPNQRPEDALYSGNERRVNRSQVEAIESLFDTHPSVSACRTVLHGQLLSGGIVLRRAGEEVALTPAFKLHLDEVWIQFAASVIDSFLKFGYVVVSYEEHDDDGDPSAPRRIVPIVPPTDTYQLAYTQGGRAGYVRKYFVYATDGMHASSSHDEHARVIVRTPPDGSGNVNSPMATIFELASFVDTLSELAVQSEVCNARPRVWTQARRKDVNGFDDGTLFFDAESSDMRDAATSAIESERARALAAQVQLCDALNKMQNMPRVHAGSVSHRRMCSERVQAAREVLPSMFTVPKDQEVVSNAGHMPTTRPDLERLIRLSIDQFSAAMGVPSDLLFQGHFAGKTSAQLALLNSTVSQLSKWVSMVLTRSYNDIYGDGGRYGETYVQLLVTPLASTQEIINMHRAGLAPRDLAMRSCLHAIGISSDEIKTALAELSTESSDKTHSDLVALAHDDDWEQTAGVETAFGDAAPPTDGRPPRRARDDAPDNRDKPTP